jgi:PAS domain S-box-containing protein
MDFTLLESVPDAMVIVDDRGRIVFVNRQTEQLFGYTRDELLGSALETLIPERFRQGHVAHRNGYFSAPRTRPMGVGFEVHARRKSGEEFPVEISLSPIETDGGRLFASAIRDITDRQHVEAERTRLIEERTAHADADRIKDEFLATLSHELRTPLNAVLGWATMLKQGSLEPGRAQHALAAIERNARLQAQLMEDLLDISRVIQGKLHLELVPFDLVQTAEAAVDVVQPSAMAKRIHLDFITEQRPILLRGDRSVSNRSSGISWPTPSSSHRRTVAWNCVCARMTPP